MFKSTLRYVDILSNLTVAYNASFHLSIRATPESINIGNEDVIRKRLYKPKQLPLIWKFKTGDTVWLQQTRRSLKRGYPPSWTDEIFMVKRWIPTNLLTYSVYNYHEEVIEGKFYTEELQKLSKKTKCTKLKKC